MLVTEHRSHADLLSGVFGSRYEFDEGQHHIAVRTRDARRVLGVLRQDLGYTLLSSVALVTTRGHEHLQGDESTHWDLTLNLLNLEEHQRCQVHVLLGAGEELPDLEGLYPGLAKSLQRARAEAEGPAPVPLVLPRVRRNPNLSEAPYPEELNQWYLFDLAHPLTRHQWELAVEAFDGKVQNTIFQSGYWRRGLSAKAPQLHLRSLAPLLDVVMPAAAPFVNVTWAKGLEDFFRWEIPERAQALRMVFIELSRLGAHLELLARMAEELQITEAAQLCREGGERIKQAFEFYSGARVTTNLATFGGMPHDLPPGWVQEAFSLLRSVESVLVQYLRLLTQNPLARRRLQVAGISGQTALGLGLTGPVLRAAGVNFDLRKAEPFYFYRDVDFEVPVGLRGEAHDRLLILLEESHQSLRILWQLLDHLPLGAVALDDDFLVRLNSFSLAEADWRERVQSARRPWCSQYTALESPYGEFGFHVVFSAAGPSPWALKIKTPAEALRMGLQEILRGCPVRDLALALSSLDLSPGALDL